MSRFLIQKSEKPNHFVATDRKNGLVVIFQKGKFNETQEIIELKDLNPDEFMKIARINREISEWLIEYHKDKI